MTNASPTLPALGAELQNMLATPHAYTIGQSAAVIERLLAELQIMQLRVPADGQADRSLDALFDADVATDPLSADDVSVLANQLSTR